MLLNNNWEYRQKFRSPSVFMTHQQKKKKNSISSSSRLVCSESCVPQGGYSELGKTPVATVSYPAFHQPPGCQRAFQHSGGSQAWHQRHQGTLRQLPDQCQFGSDLVWCFPETGKGQTSPFHLVKIDLVHVSLSTGLFMIFDRKYLTPSVLGQTSVCKVTTKAVECLFKWQTGEVLCLCL